MVVKTLVPFLRLMVGTINSVLETVRVAPVLVYDVDVRCELICENDVIAILLDRRNGHCLIRLRILHESWL